LRAETHLEVYRPFSGELREDGARFWPLAATGLSTALKQRKALFILYLPALIVTVILCFVVYIKFTAEAALDGEIEEELDLQGQLIKGMVLAQSKQLLDVVNLILEFSKGMGGFALLAVAWFASGLFCEDRKAGAHQLYFARPITRLDYFLGKFLIAAFFAACAMLVPLLAVCIAAVFSSPEWSFLEHEWDVFLRVIAFSALWTVVASSLVLTASSLASRKSFALLGVFAFVMISVPVAGTLNQFVDSRLLAVALLVDLDSLARWFFDRPQDDGVSVGSAWTAVITMLVVCWALIGWRLRRLEVVA
jgi:ABC-type transport system involved in multi-copper enzyme maturation permease subunit